MSKGFANAAFERSGPHKLRPEKLMARQVDKLCYRFNVTAVRKCRAPNPKVGNLEHIGRSLARTSRLFPARS